jgi:hypothetical protein
MNDYTFLHGDLAMPNSDATFDMSFFDTTNLDLNDLASFDFGFTSEQLTSMEFCVGANDLAFPGYPISGAVQQSGCAILS